jgi:glycine cleavage system aminomethyltransferase T/glycine/D-amino acid oxidase-like deaminating enzyme
MTSPPTQARAVVIGCGIVGNSVAYHLTRLGWSDVVLIDKGPLPNPGGSTGHASNFIFLVDHSKEMTQLTLESVRQYEELGVLTVCGGIEVARTEERMEELRRRMASAKAWGVEPVSLVTPAEIKELVPFVDESILLGGFYAPGVGVADSLRAGTLMRERGTASGGLTVLANTEVHGMRVEGGRICSVETSKGSIEAETVVVACGVWSPLLAAMAGARIPLTPMVHQMIDIGPVPRFEATAKAIEFPIVRDMDVFMYERQDGTSLEIGSYAHRSIHHDPEEIPSIEAASLSPTEFPFTQADFDPQMQDALDLMPEIVGDESVGVKYAINGLLSATPDGMPILGETPEVRGLWSAAAVWVKEGPGVGKSVAEWMIAGESEIDLHSSDVSRFHPHQQTRAHIKARTGEAFPKFYGIVHPAEQWASDRELRLPPMFERERSLGAVFYEVAGWERPHWYEANAPLVERYGLESRAAEWDARWWSPIVNAEHLAMREHAGLFDLSAFAIFDVTGPGALEALQGAVLAQMDVPVGRVVYTPVLGQNGGFRSDLTIMRLGEDEFRIVTGGAHGMADRKLFVDRLPGDGSASLVDVTTAWTTIGLWGPRARDILASASDDDVTNEGFPFGTCRTIDVGSQQVLASRISYVGDLGWELYTPIEQGARLWDTLWEAGEPSSLTACGIGVYGTTGRLEKCYRAFGAELESEYTVVEAGMQRPRVKEQDFVGKEAHLRHREEEQVATLCTLTIDDHTAGDGRLRYPLGGEPIVLRDGTPLTDARGRRSYVTSAGAGPSLGRHILLAHLPAEEAVEGSHALAVEYMTERLPVTVDVVGSTPIFDPENARIRS